MEYRYSLNDTVKISQESSSGWRGKLAVILGLNENIYGEPAYKIAVDVGTSFCPAALLVDEKDLHRLGLLESLKIRRRFPSRNIVSGVELVHETELL
ncbi:MAG TPA: hypothetical protein VJJ21_00160 [Candidatus Nanoarchaeia archaeon]|nr:hypothetical protein [Candidatus Nanoarchaeia archaeon]